MKLFLLYLRKLRLPALTFALFSAVFALSFYLYDLPMGAVAYPILFCLFLALVIIAADFIRSLAKYKRLRALGRVAELASLELPEAGSLEEAGYQEALTALMSEARELARTRDEELRELTDYYTVWVHQIKLPITAMSLTLQNEDTPEYAKLRSQLSEINRYVEMVLAFLRLRSDTTDFVFGEYGLDPIIRRAIAKFSSEFIDRKLRLQYEPVDFTAVTDEKWLLFVLEQIISNALKYTKAGTIAVFMEGRTLNIEDTGAGIAPEDLPRIFERGYTGQNGRENASATGLGLYLCREICGKLKIDISVSSTVGKGTRVSLDFREKS